MRNIFLIATVAVTLALLLVPVGAFAIQSPPSTPAPVPSTPVPRSTDRPGPPTPHDPDADKPSPVPTSGVPTESPSDKPTPNATSELRESSDGQRNGDSDKGSVKIKFEEGSGVPFSYEVGAAKVAAALETMKVALFIFISSERFDIEQESPATLSVQNERLDGE